MVFSSLLRFLWCLNILELFVDDKYAVFLYCLCVSIYENFHQMTIFIIIHVLNINDYILN
jgi:hypothetical protein